jgi:adenosine 3'-phospho 5'-phosphosulfate transporter B3
MADKEALLESDKPKLVSEPLVTSAPQKEKLIVFGLVDLTEWSENSQAAVLAGGALLSSLGFAYLQEKVFLIPGFHFHGFMTLLTTLTYMVCAFIERVGTGETHRRAPMRDYVQLSVWTMAGMYFTNWSLTYVNYPTRILAKSSKVIPVMIVGMIVQGRYYSRLEYLSAFILAAGITLFTMGDAYDSPRFDVRGLALISIGVFADAMTANFEEARLFRTHHCSQAEVMFFSSGFSAVWTLATMLGSDELFDAVAHARENTQVIVWTVLFASLGYSSVVFVLLLIKRFGATNAEIVKSCRKVFSIIISFLAFGKTVGHLHVLGGALFTLSVALGVHIKTRKMAAKREARKNRKDGVIEEEEEYHGGGGA